MATLTSVSAYHPLRTIATRLIDGSSIIWTPSALYREFFYGSLASHQLFILTTAETQLRQRTQLGPIERDIIGGFLSTFTITPCEVATVQRQLYRSSPKEISSLMRGFSFLAVRQTGLGIGFIGIPSLYLTDKDNITRKTIINLFGGFVAAASTQVFEQSRVLVQSDLQRTKYPKIHMALRPSIKIIFTKRGLTLFGLRCSILMLSSTVLNLSRDFYRKFL